ncbi:MAG: protein translocase subunit SecD [bacterium]|nr:protein translocase subunit SecD [bacterium]
MVENLSRKVTLILALLGLAILSIGIMRFRLGLDLRGGTRLVYSVNFQKAVDEGKIQAEEALDKDRLLGQMIDIWRKRIDPDGVREPVIRKEGIDRIVIELPGSVTEIRERVVSTIAAPIDIRGERIELDPADEDQVERFPVGGGVIEIENEQIRYGRRIGSSLEQIDRGYLGTTKAAHAAGASIELRASDPWRQKIENIGSLGFYIAAKAGDFESRSVDLSAETQKAKDWAIANPGAEITEYNALLAESPDADLKRLRFFPMEANEDNKELSFSDRLRALIVEKDPDWHFTGSDLPAVYPSNDSLGRLAVGFRLADTRSADFTDFTEEHIDQQMAIVINDEIATFPVIRNTLPGGGVIEGGAKGFSNDEVNHLIAVLRSGSLRIKPQFEAQETVGATLGSDYVRRGALSATLGLLFVIIFVIVYYRRLGIFAAMSLLFNLSLLMGALSFLRATLTLPGVAGIILTVGMAVDANILIYERIREEALRGRKPMQAAKDGFKNALSTIVDANLTTLITALILYKFGTGPVRGFATTLSIGILTSMFSALVVTRVLVHIQLEKGIESFNMMRLVQETKIAFMSKARVAMIASSVLIVAGVGLFMSIEDKDKLGIDFLGGLTMTIRTEQTHTEQAMRTTVKGLGGEIGKSAEVKAILDSGDSSGYSQFRITFKSEQEPDVVKGIIRRSLEEQGLLQKGPTADFAIDGTSASGTLYFERSHAAADIQGALTGMGIADANVTVAPGAATNVFRFTGTLSSTRSPDALADQIGATLPTKLDTADDPFLLASPISEVSLVGAQVVGELRDKAIFAILISLFAVVMYIRVRFTEYSFGFAAVIALVHDVLITLGCLAVAIKSGLIEAELSLPMIAAFLTIIGYSLNDTIVVFDRVRENLPRSKGSLSEVIDRSLNQTLARTLLTSVTTLITVLLLLFFNLGSRNVLEGFAFALAVGVIVGTYSSMFVASPALLWLETMRRKGGDGGEAVATEVQAVPS